MTESPPRWQAHSADNYDSVMTAHCTTLLGEIITDPARRRDILADPRNLHRELFAPFTPLGYGEYAGTYRGTPGTPLTDRTSSSESQLEVGKRYVFCPPSDVSSRMTKLLESTRAMFGSTDVDDYSKLLGLTYTFCWFGKIHPFLDGNGHIQRAILAAMATDFGFPLSARFAIHPRPFDRLFAIALEIFTRAPSCNETEGLELVAEYLAFFLDGPFNAPRKHVGTTPLYA